MSAPATACESAIVWAVELEPVPATIGIRPPACRAAWRISSACSARVRVAASPVVPAITRALVPGLDVPIDQLIHGRIVHGAVGVHGCYQGYEASAHNGGAFYPRALSRCAHHCVSWPLMGRIAWGHLPVS